MRAPPLESQAFRIVALVLASCWPNIRWLICIFQHPNADFCHTRWSQMPVMPRGKQNGCLRCRSREKEENEFLWQINLLFQFPTVLRVVEPFLSAMLMSNTLCRFVLAIQGRAAQFSNSIGNLSVCPVSRLTAGARTVQFSLYKNSSSAVAAVWCS